MWSKANIADCKHESTLSVPVKKTIKGKFLSADIHTTVILPERTLQSNPVYLKYLKNKQTKNVEMAHAMIPHFKMLRRKSVYLPLSHFTSHFANKLTLSS